MTEIATLALAVDSRPVVLARGELDALVRSGLLSEDMARRLSKSFQGASAPVEQFTRGTRAARAELVNLSRQVQDITVSLGSGQSFGTVLLQQGAQVGDIFSSSGRSAKEWRAQLLGLVTPARAVAAGTLLLGTAAYFAVTGWKSFALQLDDTAKRMGETTRSAAALQAAASLKGIDADDFAKDMARFSDETYRARNNMGDLAELARANGLHINGTADALAKVADLVQRAGSEQQKIAILQQAGLPATAQWVRYLENGSEGLRKAKLEAVEFGGAINDEMVAKARMFDESWNRITTNFATRWRSALIDTGSLFERWGDGITAILTKIPGIGANVPTNVLKSAFSGTGVPGTRLSPNTNVADFYNGIGAFATKPGGAPVDPNAARNNLNLEQQRLGILGQLVTVGEAVRQKEIEIALARLSGVKITAQEAERLKDLAAQQALGTYQLRQQTEAMKTEAGAVGLGAGAAAAFRAEQERLADFRLRGIKLTNEQAAAIRGEADALGAATQRAAERRALSETEFARSQLGRTDSEQNVANTLRQLYGDDFQSQQNGVIANNIRLVDSLRDIKSTGESALSGLLRDFRDGKTAAEAFGNVLTKLQDKLFDIAANKIVSSLIGSAGGFNFSSLFGGGSSGGLAASGGSNSGFAIGSAHEGAIVGHEATFARLFGGAPRHHTGTGNLGVDEVPIIGKRGEGIFTEGQMRKLAPVGQGGSAAPIVVNVNTLPGTTAEVSESRDAKGGRTLEVTMRRMIDDTAAELVRSGKSNLHDAMKDRFSLRPAI